MAGFHQYRCKYFVTHNCPNLVYIFGSCCAYCAAQGREHEKFLSVLVDTAHQIDDYYVVMSCQKASHLHDSLEE
ncbi:hypothetical protein F4825DRAFT_407754 [Nemania diffusa]|nr:hypothetical protein F4825DRAFT_407754 [Nemania diffusa]